MEDSWSFLPAEIVAVEGQGRAAAPWQDLMPPLPWSGAGRAPRQHAPPTRPG